MNQEHPAFLTAEEIQAQLPEGCHIDATGKLTREDLDIILAKIREIKAGKEARE